MDTKIRIGDVVELRDSNSTSGYIVIQDYLDKCAIEEISNNHLKLSFICDKSRLRVLF